MTVHNSKNNIGIQKNKTLQYIQFYTSDMSGLTPSSLSNRDICDDFQTAYRKSNTKDKMKNVYNIVLINLCLISFYLILGYSGCETPLRIL